MNPNPNSATLTFTTPTQAFDMASSGAQTTFEEFEIAAADIPFPTPMGPVRVHYLISKKLPSIIYLFLLELFNKLLHHLRPNTPVRASLKAFREAIYHAHGCNKGTFKVSVGCEGWHR